MVSRPEDSPEVARIRAQLQGRPLCLPREGALLLLEELDGSQAELARREARILELEAELDQVVDAVAGLDVELRKIREMCR